MCLTRYRIDLRLSISTHSLIGPSSASPCQEKEGFEGIAEQANEHHDRILLFSGSFLRFDVGHSAYQQPEEKKYSVLGHSSLSSANKSNSFAANDSGAVQLERRSRRAVSRVRLWQRCGHCASLDSDKHEQRQLREGFGYSTLAEEEAAIRERVNAERSKND